MSQKKRKQAPRKKQQGSNLYAWIFGIAAIVLVGAIIWGMMSQGTEQQSAAPLIDDIACQGMEGAAQHEHSHLSIFNNGERITVPADIGINEASRCMYWLHTHDATGMLHVESPVIRSFTLGNFFDIWGKPLSTTQVAEYTNGAPLKVFVNGKEFTGDPRTIQLERHTLISLQVGPTFVDPPTFTFPAGS